MFARVRPAKDSEAAEAAPGKAVVGYPAAGDLLGRGLELRQPAASGGPKGGSSSDVQAHTFGFDRVFAPTASQVVLAGVLATVLAGSEAAVFRSRCRVACSSQPPQHLDPPLAARYGPCC